MSNVLSLLKEERTHLNARFPQIHAEPVRVATVVLDELQQRPEGGPPGDEEAALVELPNAIVLDRVAVAHGERVVVAPGLAVADEEGAVLVLRHEQLLLRLQTLDLAEIPPAIKGRTRPLTLTR